MTISFIQSDAAHGENVHDVTATFPGATTAGRALLAVCETTSSFPQNRHMVPPAGWTTVYDVIANNMAVTVARKVASGSEAAVTFTCDDDTASLTAEADRTVLVILEIAGTYEDVAVDRTSGSTSKTVAPITPDAGVEALLVAVGIKGNAHGINGHPSGYTEVEEDVTNDGASERLSAYWKHVDTTSGSYSATITYAGSADRWAGIHAWFSAIVAAPVADFEADHTAIIEGETVEFTDLSLNTPTSWSWDFGDGGTSTSQNPSHVYSVAGPYTVSLTATNAQGSDTETKTFYINVTINVGFEEPPPDGVLLEIYAAAPGSARWDHANWDEALWSTAGWQDVTPEGITVDITWGSRQPERGILSRPEAADWSVSFYDPQRRLDPANVDSPFFGDVEPGLPIRASHRGTVIRQGYATGIRFSYADTFTNGFIRATDNVSLLANASVPSDTTLADTLYARAVDAIAAAGLTVRVLDPVGTDPPVAGWETGVNEWSAWQWIMDAAEQVNHIPVITNTNDLTFRAWSSPLARGRSMDSPNLVDLQVVADYQGQYSVTTALDDDGVTIEERALTPPPRYGARIYSRTDETIDAAGWTERVLADRALPGLRWVPGDVYPLTANDVQNFATLQAVELVSVALTEQSPPVSATVIIVGGRLHVEGKRNSEATWLFGFEAAQTAAEPLIESGGDPTDYLLATGGDQFLYPSS